MKTVVSKGEYAALKGRRPSAVSNWIRDGKISAAALIGHGHNAKIWVEQADEDLALSLDPLRQAVQAKPIAVRGELHEDAIRRRRALADSAEHSAEAARRRLALDEGRWVDAAAAHLAWSRQLAAIVADLDVFILAALPALIADRFAIVDRAAVAETVRRTLARHRADVAMLTGGPR